MVSKRHVILPLTLSESISSDTPTSCGNCSLWGRKQKRKIWVFGMLGRERYFVLYYHSKPINHLTSIVSTEMVFLYFNSPCVGNSCFKRSFSSLHDTLRDACPMDPTKRRQNPVDQMDKYGNLTPHRIRTKKGFYISE